MQFFFSLFCVMAHLPFSTAKIRRKIDMAKKMTNYFLLFSFTLIKKLLTVD